MLTRHLKQLRVKGRRVARVAVLCLSCYGTGKTMDEIGASCPACQGRGYSVKEKITARGRLGALV